MTARAFAWTLLALVLVAIVATVMAWWREPEPGGPAVATFLLVALLFFTFGVM